MSIKSVGLRAAEVKAEEFNKSLTLYDFAPSNWVHLKTDEGFEVDVPAAFVLQWEGWYMIFAEHHDPIIVDKEETVEIYQYQVMMNMMKKRDIPLLKKFKFNPKGDKYRTKVK